MTIMILPLIDFGHVSQISFVNKITLQIEILIRPSAFLLEHYFRPFCNSKVLN